MNVPVRGDSISTDATSTEEWSDGRQGTTKDRNLRANERAADPGDRARRVRLGNIRRSVDALADA